MPRIAILVALVAALAAALAVPTAGGARALAATACSGADDPNAPAGAQRRAMLCLVNAARAARGRSPFSAARPLDRAAARKSVDILACDEFDHEACGRSFTHWIEHFGYRGCRAGENIGWGTGPLGSPEAIFRSWMRSAGHRRNILGPFKEIGIGLRVGKLEGNAGAHVWVQNFGSRDC